MTDYKYLYSDKYTEVSDLALASAIQYLGFTVIALNRDPKDHPKVSFVFEKSDELNNAIHRYWEGLLLIEPKAFWNIARELKSRVRIS
jgi:hypothetical protein